MEHNQSRPLRTFQNQRTKEKFHIMLCFRDMTFCHSNCINAECKRHFDAKDRLEAEIWWGTPTAPVASADFSDGCKDYLKPEGDDDVRCGVLWQGRKAEGQDSTGDRQSGPDQDPDPNG